MQVQQEQETLVVHTVRVIIMLIKVLMVVMVVMVDLQFILPVIT